MAAPTTSTAAGELSEHVRGAVAGIADAAKAESADAEAAVRTVISEFEALSAELEERKAELARLEADEAQLPHRVYKAALRDDPEAEQMLRARYVAACDRLPGVRSRIEVLEAELSGYYSAQNAKSWGVDAAVEHQAKTQLRPGAATSQARRELLQLRASVLEALDGAISELSPDTAQSVKLARELDRQREAAARLVRAEANR